MDIVPADFSHVKIYRPYIQACWDGGIVHYEEALEDTDEYLYSLINAAQGMGLPAGHLPCNTYFAIENNQILGAIRLRIGTNKYVEQVIGHIGYEVRPSARGKGVAKALLQWVVSNVLETDAIVSCGANNLASKQVIESTKADFLGETDTESDGLVLRYKIRCLQAKVPV